MTMNETAYTFESDSYTAKSEAIREASAIEKQMMELRGATDEAQKAIEMLRQRLSPVLRPDSDKMLDGDTAPHPIRSPLVDQIAGQVSGVQSIARRTHELLHLLDL